MTQHREHASPITPRSTASVFLLAFALLILLTLPASAKTLKGKVVGVVDGDTLTVLVDGKGERIRLYGIDCPEKAQPYGKAAKKRTSELVFGQTVCGRPTVMAARSATSGCRTAAAWAHCWSGRVWRGGTSAMPPRIMILNRSSEPLGTRSWDCGGSPIRFHLGSGGIQRRAGWR